jgi:hypothetical protein
VLEARRLKKSRAAYGSWPYYWRLLQATVTVRAIHDSEVLVNVRRNSRQLEAPNEVSASALAADEPQIEWRNLDGTPIYQHHGPKCPRVVLRRAACQCCDGTVTTSGLRSRLVARSELKLSLAVSVWRCCPLVVGPREPTLPKGAARRDRRGRPLRESGTQPRRPAATEATLRGRIFRFGLCPNFSYNLNFTGARRAEVARAMSSSASS